MNTCPVDRRPFQSIIATKYNSKKILKEIQVEDKQNESENPEDDFTFCEVCGRSDREDRMLLCDGCDRGYHCECLIPQVELIPEGQWFCVNCLPGAHVTTVIIARPTTSRSATNNRLIARTNFSERIRRNVNRNRSERAVTFLSGFFDDEEDEEEMAPTRIAAVSRRKPIKRLKTRKAPKRRRRRKYVTKKTTIKTENGGSQVVVTKRLVKRRKKRRVVKRRRPTGLAATKLVKAAKKFISNQKQTPGSNVQARILNRFTQIQSNKAVEDYENQVKRSKQLFNNSELSLGNLNGLPMNKVNYLSTDLIEVNQ